SGSYAGPDNASASVSGTCTDKAGNTGGATFALHYDATPPTVSSATPDRGPDADGWYNHTLSVAFTGTDATSGIASCDSPSYAKPDSSKASLSGRCRDNAGNVSDPGGFSFKPDGEIIKKVLRGLAYKSGVFYSVEIYETSAPKVALQELMRGTDHSKASRRELIVNGYKGREYTYTGESSYTVYQYFATNKRFYVIKAVSRRGGNSALRYFLNSLRLGNAEPSADNPVPPDVENAINDYAPQQPADIYLPEEVEIKAMIVWTPDTIYAKFFPLKKLTDPVKVSMILTSTGEVIDVKVISGAKGDSSGMVAEAIKATKFLPAEKKGHPVSERVVLSLDFGL
ncbi:MAG: hypothetical protein ACJ741_14345, partial [Pyrinomonadaceae bacterium]